MDNTSKRTIPTTFGLFIEWYFDWRYNHDEILQRDDVTDETVKEWISCYVDGTFEDDERKFDLFFGVKERVFDTYGDVAKFIRDAFDERIVVREFDDKFTPFVLFTVRGVDFEMSTCNYFGEYEYDVDERGFAVK